MKICLLSDTHGYMDDAILKHVKDCDEVWHAGDIGNKEVLLALEATRPTRAVYGNIDGAEIRAMAPKVQDFEIEGNRIVMTHIAGRPGRYAKGVGDLLKNTRPAIFICGHSHILLVQHVGHKKLLWLNPGACGRHGFHKMRTLLKFEIALGKPRNMQVVELGPRSALE